jgi:hypothetical protein
MFQLLLFLFVWLEQSTWYTKLLDSYTALLLQALVFTVMNIGACCFLSLLLTFIREVVHQTCLWMATF